MQLAYGVDPKRSELYSLRQARYDAAADEIEKIASDGKSLSVLDIGCGTGTLVRHLEPRGCFAQLTMSATNFYEASTYRQERYRSYIICDLNQDCPEIPSNSFDIVVCEQVLEHVVDVENGLRTLARVAKDGGTLIVGVPIFVAPLRLAREKLVPKLDAMIFRQKERGHVQAFSAASFERHLSALRELKIVDRRGFRIVSGGILRRLENHRWYWQLNRRIGQSIPWACVEIQYVLRKRGPAAQA